MGENDTFNEKTYRAQFDAEVKALDSDEDISKVLDKEIKNLQESIKDIAREHYSKIDERARTLADKMIEDAGLTKKEADAISNAIQNEFKKRVKKVAEKELTKNLGVTKLSSARRAKKLSDQLIEQINLGALDTDFYNSLFAEKYGLAKPLTVEQRQELKKLADIAASQETGSLFERKAVMDMLKYMDSLFPNNNRLNTFFSLYYASLLSGMSTSTYRS